MFFVVIPNKFSPCNPFPRSRPLLGHMPKTNLAGGGRQDAPMTKHHVVVLKMWFESQEGGRHSRHTIPVQKSGVS